MKKRRVCLLFPVMLALLPVNRVHAQAAIADITKEAIKKVIVAVDFKIQRLQTKTIWLQNAQKVVENDMAKLKLDEITDWVQRQKDLYQTYFDELWKVKDVLVYYHKVKEITSRQLALVKEYKRAWDAVHRDGHFTPAEVSYIGNVYTGIIEESIKNLEQVALVINSFTTQMTDAKRMELINSAAVALQQNYTDLQEFTTQNTRLSLQRAKDGHEVAVIKSLYGIQ